MRGARGPALSCCPAAHGPQGLRESGRTFSPGRQRREKIRTLAFGASSPQRLGLPAAREPWKMGASGSGDGSWAGGTDERGRAERRPQAGRRASGGPGRASVLLPRGLRFPFRSLQGGEKGRFGRFSGRGEAPRRRGILLRDPPPTPASSASAPLGVGTTPCRRRPTEVARSHQRPGGTARHPTTARALLPFF